jgi:hypothetical protein
LPGQGHTCQFFDEISADFAGAGAAADSAAASGTLRHARWAAAAAATQAIVSPRVLDRWARRRAGGGGGDGGGGSGGGVPQLPPISRAGLAL